MWSDKSRVVSLKWTIYFVYIRIEFKDLNKELHLVTAEQGTETQVELFRVDWQEHSRKLKLEASFISWNCRRTATHFTQFYHQHQYLTAGFVDGSIQLRGDCEGRTQPVQGRPVQRLPGVWRWVPVEDPLAIQWSFFLTLTFSASLLPSAVYVRVLHTTYHTKQQNFDCTAVGS